MKKGDKVELYNEYLDIVSTWELIQENSDLHSEKIIEYVFRNEKCGEIAMSIEDAERCNRKAKEIMRKSLSRFPDQEK